MLNIYKLICLICIESEKYKQIDKNESKFNVITQELIDKLILILLNLSKIDDFVIPIELLLRCPTCPCECCGKREI